MFQIPKIDLAWEAVNLLSASSVLDQASAIAIENALKAIEQAGGRDPRPKRIPPAAQELFARLYEKYSRRCPDDVPTEFVTDLHINGITPADTSASTGLTIAHLVKESRDTKQSKSFKTRQSYRYFFSRVVREHGDENVADIDKDTLQRWYAEWSASGDHTSYQLMSMLRMLFHLGSETFGNRDCARLFGTIRDIRIKRGKARTQEVTAEQITAIRAEAHNMGFGSIALAQALQFDLGLTQKQVLGEWVPLSEPGTSEVTNANQKWLRRPQKWLRGLCWTDIDPNLILRMDECDIDLRLMPSVMEELKRLGKRPIRGPMIVYEKSNRPYYFRQFGILWRTIADAAGVPKSVHNRDSARSKKGNGEQQPRTTALVRKDRANEYHAMINAVLPRYLPDEVRSEVFSDMLHDLIGEKLAKEEIPEKWRQYLSRHRKEYSNRFNTVSLDQPMPGTTLRLIDVIPSEQGI